MQKGIDFYYPYNNTIVTKNYINTVMSAFEKMGYELNAISSFKEKTHDNIFVATVFDSIKAKKRGYKKVFLWVQGIIPEESFLRNKSHFRKWFLSRIEKKGLLLADFVFYVSSAMKDYVEKKYNYITKNYYIMPCFNDELHEEAFFTIDKYKNNTFLYAGSLDQWQCFKETLEIFKNISEKVDDCYLRILTKRKEEAEIAIQKIGIKNYSIDFVEPDKIGEEMKKIKFGFSLRRDDPVNQVSTPTKLSTYIAYGVLPIYSDCLLGFAEVAKDNPYCIRCNVDSNDLSAIIQMCKSEIDSNKVYEMMKRTFGSYYSTRYHIDCIVEELKK